MKCKLKSLLLVLAAMLCSSPLFAHDFEVGGIYYNITSNADLTVAVTFKGDYYDSFTNEYSGTVTIPESVTYNEKTYSVTSIGYAAFYNCYHLTSITIPNSVTSIGNYAFESCTILTSITIPNSVTSIGNAAFYNCCSLTSVTIPNSVTSIGDAAFRYCTGLTSITIPNSVTSIGYRAFSECTKLTSITIPNSVTSIGNLAFDRTAWYNNQPDGVVYAGKVLYTYKGTMPENTSIAVKEGTVSISLYAFAECSNLTSITIPNSVTSIGDKAFSECTGLTSITIPNSVTSIGGAAFSVCSGLTSITIPNSVTSIEYSAFEFCSGLTSITIPNSVTSIGDYAFAACRGLTSITIPNSVTSIGSSAFASCWGLTSITIPNSVTSIGEGAFYNCTRLTSITIPNSVTSIRERAFYNCYDLTSITIPNSVTSIGDYAFYNCNDLTSVTIPNSVTSIGDEAFYGCTALAEFISHIPADKLFPVGSSVFDGLPSNSVLTVPAGAKATYEATDGWKDFNNIVEMGPKTVVLAEGEDFVNEEECEAATVTYSRTLPNLMWNALYLPVEIPMEALSENYDVAYFNNMHAYDRNSDGTIDEMNMEVFLIKEGTLLPNYPYFIRAKNEAAKQMNLELTDVKVHSTNAEFCESVEVMSAFMKFELAGVYTKHMGSDLKDCYAITAKGSWAPIAQNSYLNPFRLYLKMTTRPGSPIKVSPQALQSIRISVQGEEGTTGIAGTPMNSQRPSEIYDLQGRRVTHPTKGLYIVNGKKVLY